MSSLPDKPENVYVVHQGNNACYIVWDSVTKNVDLTPASIVGYFVYCTYNPNQTGWTTPYLALVDTINPYGEVDVFYVDYSAIGDALYQVCSWSGDTDINGNPILGGCSIGYGVSSEGTITVPKPAKWDSGVWDLDLWG